MKKIMVIFAFAFAVMAICGITYAQNFAKRKDSAANQFVKPEKKIPVEKIKVNIAPAAELPAEQKVEEPAAVAAKPADVKNAMEGAVPAAKQVDAEKTEATTIPQIVTPELAGLPAAEEAPDASALYKEAVALYWDGKYAEARAKFEQIQKTSPGYARTGYYLERVAGKLAK